MRAVIQPLRLTIVPFTRNGAAETYELYKLVRTSDPKARHGEKQAKNLMRSGQRAVDGCKGYVLYLSLD